jgi:hypothetical protein
MSSVPEAKLIAPPIPVIAEDEAYDDDVFAMRCESVCPLAELLRVR